jgi:hypothetical protein
LLHLHLLIGSSIDVPVAVDVPRHCAHSLGVDDLQPLGIGGAGGSGDNLAASDNQGAGIDDGAIADDHPDVGDRHILSRKMGRAQAQQAGQKQFSHSSILHSGYDYNTIAHPVRRLRLAVR